MSRWEVPRPPTATYPPLPQFAYPPQADFGSHHMSPLALNSIASNFKTVSTLPIGPFTGDTTTTILRTTPPSVLSPPPPTIFCSPGLPRVYVSDHSESPAVGNTKTTGYGRRSPSKEITSPAPSTRRIVEPVSPKSDSNQTTSSAETKKRATSKPSDDPSSRYLTSYQSSTPINNQWLKRLVVAIVVILVVGLTVKIVVELWRASDVDNKTNTS